MALTNVICVYFTALCVRTLLGYVVLLHTVHQAKEKFLSQAKVVNLGDLLDSLCDGCARLLDVELKRPLHVERLVNLHHGLGTLRIRLPVALAQNLLLLWRCPLEGHHNGPGQAALANLACRIVDDKTVLKVLGDLGVVAQLVEDVVRPLVEDFRVNALQVEGQADWEAVIGVGDFALDQRFVVGQVVSPNVDDTVICSETNKILLLVRDY